MQLLSSALSDKRGSTAVEFALVAPAFLALMFSIFEVGWFYFVNSQVDAATLRAARFVRTGQAQEQELNKTEFFNAVCPSLELFGDCSARVTVEVETFTDFAALAADSSPVVCSNDEPLEIGAIPYNPGADNDIVRLRICLVYNTINPAIGINVSDADAGTRRLYGTYIFRNEPFSRNGG
jgi:Flp pilus assembly protein TadG